MKSKFNTLFNLIIEQLNEYQKQLTNKAIAKRKYIDFGPIFQKERTYFSIETLDIQNLQIPKDIKNELDNAGFYIIDYRAGIAMKKALPGQQKDLRQIKIGKILNRLNKPELSKQFNERLGTSKKEIKNINFELCFTYNSYDIAGMSTDRNWTSCMELPNKFGAHGGAHHKTALRQVQYGGMCVYLINKEDKNIQKPYARIAIKRFINKKDNTFIFLPETIIYGDTDLANELHMNEKIKEILTKSNNETKNNTINFKNADLKSWSDAEYYEYIDAENLSKINVNQIEQKIKNMQSEDLIKLFESFEKANTNIPIKFINTYINTIKNNQNTVFFNSNQNNKYELTADIDIIQIILRNQQYSNEIFNSILNICDQWQCYLIARNFLTIYICKLYKLSKQQAYKILEKAKPQFTIMKDYTQIPEIIKNIQEIFS